MSRYTPRERRVTVETSIYWDNEEGTDGFCVDLEIEFAISGEYLPAKLSGPPENCYPAEYPDVEPVEICWYPEGAKCAQAIPDAWIFGDGPEGFWNPPWKDQLDMEALAQEALEQDQDWGPDEPYERPETDDDYYDRHCP